MSTCRGATRFDKGVCGPFDLFLVVHSDFISSLCVSSARFCTFDLLAGLRTGPNPTFKDYTFYFVVSLDGRCSAQSISSFPPASSFRELHHRNDMAALEAEKRTLTWALGQDAKEEQERREDARRRDELARGGVPNGRRKEVLKEPPCPASPAASLPPRNSAECLSLLACNPRLGVAMRRIFQAVDREDKGRGWVPSAVLVQA